MASCPASLHGWVRAQISVSSGNFGWIDDKRQNNDPRNETCSLVPALGAVSIPGIALQTSQKQERRCVQAASTAQQWQDSTRRPRMTWCLRSVARISVLTSGDVLAITATVVAAAANVIADDIWPDHRQLGQDTSGLPVSLALAILLRSSHRTCFRCANIVDDKASATSARRASARLPGGGERRQACHVSDP